MGLDAETILRLMLESDKIDASNPEQLLNAALKLIYPLFEQEAPSTPVLNYDNDPTDEIYERQQQLILDKHVLGLLKKTWDMLALAIEKTNNRVIYSACLREQALLILRLLNDKSQLFSLTPLMHHFLQHRIIGQGRYTKMYAEQLLIRAAETGDLMAQFCRSRRLLLIVEKPKPLQPATQSERVQKIRQCFHSWVDNNPDVKQQLSQFSYCLTQVTKHFKPQYFDAVSSLIKEFKSHDLVTLVNAPAQLPLLTFLKSNVPTLCRIDQAFSANWNEISFIPVASKTKAMRRRLYGETFPLDRSQSTPRPTTAPPRAISKKRSDPIEVLVDRETHKRAKNPRDWILNAPAEETEDETPNQLRRV